MTIDISYDEISRLVTSLSQRPIQVSYAGCSSVTVTLRHTVMTFTTTTDVNVSVDIVDGSTISLSLKCNKLKNLMLPRALTALLSEIPLSDSFIRRTGPRSVDIILEAVDAIRPTLKLLSLSAVTFSETGAHIDLLTKSQFPHFC